MGFFFVEPLVRLHHFTAHRMHAIDRDVDVIIFGVVMQTVDGLVLDKAHALQKNIHQIIHLGAGWLLVFLPRKYPMTHWHFAVDALLGQRNHLHFLAIVRGGEKVSAPGVGDFLLRIGIVRIADIIHQVANLPDLGLIRVGVLHLLDDHGFVLPNLSIARPKIRSVSSCSSRCSRLAPACRSVSK